MVELLAALVLSIWLVVSTGHYTCIGICNRADPAPQRAAIVTLDDNR